MHICDKCKKFNKCYSKNGYTKSDLAKREEVGNKGCTQFRELTIEEMFPLTDGGKKHGKNE